LEINNKLESYIKFYDNVFPEKLLSNFYRICKDEDKFHKGEINKTEKPEVNEKIRKTLIWDMKNISSKSLTEVHWANFLAYSINETSKKYSKEINVYDVNITDIQVLKYTEGGFYNFHCDDGPHTPRTLSFIFFINDEYEGGELVFNFNNSTEDLIIKKKKNRMVVWPSNFLFPHSVRPTKKGTRYKVVAWAR